MNARHPAGRVLHLLLGPAILAVLAIANGCAAGDPAAAPDAFEPEPLAAAAEACGAPLGDQGPYVPGPAPLSPAGSCGPSPTPPPAFTPGLFACLSTAGPSTLVVHADGSCFKLPSPVPASSDTYCVAGVCPPCWKLAKEVIGCILQH